MKEFAKLVIVLTIICMVSGSLLAIVNDLTKERIWDNANRIKREAIAQILGECDNDPAGNKCEISENGKDWIFFVARMNNEFSGTAFEVVSNQGYGGKISIMAGIDAEHKLCSYKILGHNETPGLGSKITGGEFHSWIEGRKIDETKWKVKKDGGDINQITAATISSRALVNAVGEGVKIFLKHKETITAFSEK